MNLKHTPLLAMILLLLLVAGCIGTDFLDESAQLFEPRIVVSPMTDAIEVNQSLTFAATYYDSTDTQQPATFTWTSSDESIVTVAEDGSATGLQSGQAEITAHAFGIASDRAFLTVVADANSIAIVRVSPPDTSILEGESLQYTAVAENSLGSVIDNVTFAWSTSDATVATINDLGVLSALIPGEIEVTAIADGISSSPAFITVMPPNRTGTFQETPGTSYRLSGMAILETNEAGNLQLRLADDFSTSNGPDLHVYLSDESRVNGRSLDLGELQGTSGEQTYSVPSNVEMDEFDYVIIHCVPFNVSFGFARLN